MANLSRGKRIAACLYVRNAQDDIQEWIAYHAMMGVGTFFIYDNLSTDRTGPAASMLQGLLDVRLISWPNVSRTAQIAAYGDCIANFGDQFDWMLFLDVDEFLVHSGGLKLDSMLDDQEDYAGYVLNWAVFGSAGHVTKPESLTIEAFTKRAPHSFGANMHTKMIVRPDRVLTCLNSHRFALNGPDSRPGGVQADWATEAHTGSVHNQNWRVNHYFVRSRDQWAAKVGRGYRSGTVRTEDDFKLHDRNEEEDASALIHLAEVKSLLKGIAIEPASRKDG